MSTGIRVS